VKHPVLLARIIFKHFIFLQGEITDRGTYEELQDRGVDFTSLLKEEKKEEEDVFSIHTLESNLSLPSSPKSN